jgi:hypothetical protein
VSPPVAGDARFWSLALLGLGLPVCIALALRVPADAAGHALAAGRFLPGALGLRTGTMLGLDPAGAARLGQGVAIAAFLALDPEPELARMHVIRAAAEIGPAVQVSAATYLRAKLDG